MSDYICGEKRNKGKDKKREKKKNPYKSGGKFRSTSVKDTDNTSKKVINKKKKRK